MKEIEFRKMVINQHQSEMIEVKGSTFKMARPIKKTTIRLYEVKVNSFSISKYEITNFQFAQFLENIRKM